MEPHPEASQAVLGWLEKSGVKASHIHKRGEWIHFAATAEQANTMMNTQFQTYRHMGKRDTDAVRTTKVEFPRDISQHIKMVHPTTRFGMMIEQASTIFKIEELGKVTAVNTVNRLINGDDQEASCNSTITPKCLMDLYKIGGVSITPAKAGRLGVAGFLNQIARYKELAKFEQQDAKWAVGANFTWEGVNGKVFHNHS
jgi:tripeptidyl-peptidase-1